MKEELKALVWVLSVIAVGGAENTCVMTATTGCVMGASYDFETQFVCGAMQAGNVPPIYDKASQGCCNQGQPYSKDLEFCCANTLYPLGAGQCVRWLRSETEKYPECYDCAENNNRALSYLDALGVAELAHSESLRGSVSSLSTEQNSDSTPDHTHISPPQLESTAAVEEAGAVENVGGFEHMLDEESENGEEDNTETHRLLATWPTSSPFDTIANGPSPTPCLEMDDKKGCFNTYTYTFVTHYPCYNLLLTWSVYGCCDGTPYRHASQTCCYLDGEYVVKNANTWCTCQSYECAPSASPTKKPTSPKPSRSPTRRPTPGPTITYYPTSEPSYNPTHQPTISHKPTPAVAAKDALDEDEFHVKYIYSGAGVLIIGMAAFVYLQGRASRLIKQRHTVVQEIDDIY